LSFGVFLQFSVVWTRRFDVELLADFFLTFQLSFSRQKNFEPALAEIVQSSFVPVVFFFAVVVLGAS